MSNNKFYGFERSYIDFFGYAHNEAGTFIFASKHEAIKFILRMAEVKINIARVDSKVLGQHIYCSTNNPETMMDIFNVIAMSDSNIYVEVCHDFCKRNKYEPMYGDFYPLSISSAKFCRARGGQHFTFRNYMSETALAQRISEPQITDTFERAVSTLF